LGPKDYRLKGGGENHDERIKIKQPRCKKSVFKTTGRRGWNPVDNHQKTHATPERPEKKKLKGERPGSMAKERKLFLGEQSTFKKVATSQRGNEVGGGGGEGPKNKKKKGKKEKSLARRGRGRVILATAALGI